MADFYTIEKRDGALVVYHAGRRTVLVHRHEPYRLGCVAVCRVGRRVGGASSATVMNVGCAPSPMICATGALTRLAGPRKS